MKQYVYHHVFIKCSAVRRPSSAVRRQSSAVRRPSSAVRRPSSAVRRPPSAVRRPSSAVRRPSAFYLHPVKIPQKNLCKEKCLEKNLCSHYVREKKFVQANSKVQIVLKKIRAEVKCIKKNSCRDMRLKIILPQKLYTPLPGFLIVRLLLTLY